MCGGVQYVYKIEHKGRFGYDLHDSTKKILNENGLEMDRHLSVWMHDQIDILYTTKYIKLLHETETNDNWSTLLFKKPHISVSPHKVEIKINEIAKFYKEKEFQLDPAVSRELINIQKEIKAPEPIPDEDDIVANRIIHFKKKD